MEQENIRQIALRLIKLRSEILKTYPFFGRLLLRMPFGIRECETAYTDMRRIVFDPDFVQRLSDDELCFVMLHELMHCVLKHCIRGRGKIGLLYNIACDIVVNSIILDAMGVEKMVIDKSEAMHLAPNKKEGRDYSAEEVYEMLIQSTKDDKGKLKLSEGWSDNHGEWEKLGEDSLTGSVWDSYVKEAGNFVGKGTGIPGAVQRHIENVYRTPKISWKQILHDYIQNDSYDYSFSRPDKRLSGEYVIPSFVEDEYVKKLDKVYYFIDTSGSVSDKAVTEAFEEIKDAMQQIGNVSGKVFFFDSIVSEPFEFENIDDIEAMKPIGGGGTDFHNIFRSIEESDEDDMPKVVIVITDGYADFPEEEEAGDIPVIWLIVDSKVEAPWGECLHIYTNEE